MIREKINSILEGYAEGTSFSLTRPTNEAFGDYATNLALALGKQTKRNPKELAEELATKLRQQLPELASVEVEGPGFINFRLNSEYFLSQIPLAVIKDYGAGIWGEGKKVLVEYSSPNIAKRFSAGHLRSTIIGDALARLYRFAGFSVVTDNHLGDWGTQFGMIIAGVEEKNADIVNLSVAELEDLYVEFNKRMDEDPTLRDKAREAFARLETGDENARRIWQQAKDISLKEFQKIYDALSVKLDHSYGEADYEQLMKKLIPEVKSMIGRESEGAWIVEYDGMPPAMLEKSNGTTTYFTRDLATVKFRQDTPELRSDLYIYEVGSEQTLHFRQVFAAVEKLGWGKKDQFVHVGHGLMTLPEGKMSTRKGRTVKLEELLKQAEERAADLGSTDSDTRHKIAIGAVKFNELRHSPTSNYVFVWDEALNMEGESGPYLQYAYVRCLHVLKDADKLSLPKEYDFNPEELKLARWLDRFGEEAEAAAKVYSPNLVCSYLFELAQRFNSFYNQHRILQATNPEEKSVRLALTSATANVLRIGLGLLGISTVENM